MVERKLKKGLTEAVLRSNCSIQTDMRKFIVTTALFGILTGISSYCASQSLDSHSRVFDCDDFIFYGFDYSSFQLAEVKRFGEKNLTKYVPAWIGFFTDRRTPEIVAKQFQKEFVSFEFQPTLDRIEKIDEDNFVSLFCHRLSEDSIHEIVKSYELNEQYGIGFLIIVECFEKSTNISTANFTFFDIKTRDILMSDRYSAKEADGYGLSNYWGQAIFETFNKYAAYVYRKNLKRYIKNNK